MKIGDRVFIKGIVDEIRKDVVIIKNAGGYFGTVPSEIIDNAEPTTLGKIKAEIQQIEPYDLPWDKRTPEHIRDMALEIIDKYAEQEPTDKSNLEKICEELAAENDDLRDQLAMRDRFKQEPCDDAVSRQEVLDLVNSDWKYKGLKADIESLPSVRPQEPKTETWSIKDVADTFKKHGLIREQEPKTGHWIIEDMFDGDVAYRCSECNELFWIESGTPKDNEYNFCPKCGKRLVEPQGVRKVEPQGERMNETDN